MAIVGVNDSSLQANLWFKSVGLVWGWGSAAVSTGCLKKHPRCF